MFQTSENLCQIHSNPKDSMVFFLLNVEHFFAKSILGLREDVELEVGFLHEVAILTGKRGGYDAISGVS